jgi:protein-tyrosine phosphatase
VSSLRVGASPPRFSGRSALPLCEDGQVRWIELEGAVNVRDVGGLPTVDGRRTAERRVLRADNLQGLTESDVALLVDEIGLTTVVDLRSTGEVELEGPGPLTRVASLTFVHQSVIPEGGQATDAAADGVLALAERRERVLAHYPDDPVTAYYLGYISDRPDSVVGSLRAIAEAPSTVLVHCAAGKDRTGVVVALALSVAGVEREAVVADYVASGERIDAIMDRLRASETYAADLDKMPANAHKPRAETMVAFLQQIDERHDGVLPWLKTHGFDGSDVDRLQSKLLG